jgi:hypothetical protein
VTRNTTETGISIAVNLDGTGAYDVSTGIGFLDHMVEQFSRHSLIDIRMKVDGDLHVDQHHTTEDSAIALGQAIAQALGDKAGIGRYGAAYSPMDETLSRVALDISGRPFLVWKAKFTQEKLGEWDTELIERIALNDLPPGKAHFTAKNIDELNAEFVNYLNYGGYPEAVFSPTVRTDPSQYIKSDIIDKVLLRDLPSLYGISDIQELNRLFTTLAYNSGNEVSLNDLSKTSGVAKNTINRYMEYLEAAFLIRRVERIDQNAKRFKRASAFKVYLNNPSMRAALFGSITAESPAMGALTETAIYSQWQHNQQAELFYARWNSGEVDIVHMAGSDLKPNWAVEVKWSDRPYQSRGELDNCVEFAQKHPNISSPMLVTSRTVSDALVSYKGMNFEFRPSSIYAYTVGANLVNRFNSRSVVISA